MSATALHLYDPDTGEVVDPSDESVLLEMLNREKQDKDNLQRQYIRALRRIKTLEEDKEKAREEAPERNEIKEAFAFWQEKAGKHRSKLSADRFDAVMARLKEGYTLREIKQAIAGIVFDPYVVEARNGRRIAQNDLELAMRDGKRLEAYAMRAPKGWEE